MQALVEVKGDGYHFTAVTDSPRDVAHIMALAVEHEEYLKDQPQTAPLMGSMDQAARDAKSSQAQDAAAKSSRSKKPAEKPQEAAAAVAAPEAPPEPMDVAQGDPSVANGHDNHEAVLAASKDICVAALVRNRVGVQKLLEEFGVTRFSELKPDADKMQAFAERAARL